MPVHNPKKVRNAYPTWLCRVRTAYHHSASVIRTRPRASLHSEKGTQCVPYLAAWTMLMVADQVENLSGPDLLIGTQKVRVDLSAALVGEEQFGGKHRKQSGSALIFR